MSGKYWTKCGKLFLRDGKPIFSDVCPCPFGALLVRVDYGLDSSQNPYQLPYYEGAVFWGLVSIKNEKLYYQDIELDKEIYQPDGSYYIIRKYKCIKDLQTFNDYKTMQPFCFFENLYIESGTDKNLYSKAGYAVEVKETVEYTEQIITWIRESESNTRTETFNVSATAEVTLTGSMAECETSCSLFGFSVFHAGGGGSDVNEPWYTGVTDPVEHNNIPISKDFAINSVTDGYINFSMSKVDLPLWVKYVTDVVGEWEAVRGSGGEIIYTIDKMPSQKILSGAQTYTETQNLVYNSDPDQQMGSNTISSLTRICTIRIAKSGTSFSEYLAYNELSEDLK